MFDRHLLALVLLAQGSFYSFPVALLFIFNKNKTKNLRTPAANSFDMLSQVKEFRPTRQQQIAWRSAGKHKILGSAGVSAMDEVSCIIG